LLSGILFLLGGVFAGLEYRSLRTIDRFREASDRRPVVARPPGRPASLAAPASPLELPPIPTPRTAAVAAQTAIPSPATSEPRPKSATDAGPVLHSLWPPLSRPRR